MTDELNPAADRLSKLFRTAAWSRDTLCVFPGQIDQAQEIVDGTHRPANVAVFDGERIVDSKTVLPTSEPKP